MTGYAAHNLRRLIDESGMTYEELAERAGLDRRTIMGVSNGSNRPHSRTINRLAEGLGVSTVELFLVPKQLAHQEFDRETNPVVKKVMKNHPELFSGWTVADIDELHSRFGAGGALTLQGTLAVVREMNDSRRIHEKLATLLESGQAKLIRSIVELMYDQITMTPPGEGEE